MPPPSHAGGRCHGWQSARPIARPGYSPDMTAFDEVIALVQSHVTKDRARFMAQARAIAANWRGAGRVRHADRLDDVIRREVSNVMHVGTAYADMLTGSKPTTTLNDIYGEHVRGGLQGLIEEQKRRDDLLAAGLAPAWRVLLVGPPGTGKTYSAAAIAGELGLPLFRVRPDGLIRSHMGESAARIGKVFSAMREERGVYLFDEFDGIAPQRNADDGPGQERAHTVNALLQFMDEDAGRSVVVCATNHPRILDQALGRRFDAVVIYRLPTTEEVVGLLKAQSFQSTDADLLALARIADGLSHAEILDACVRARKAVILRPGADLMDHARRTLTARREAATRSSGQA